MLAFITRQGGAVRYDGFANEHLHGRSGFYRQYLDLSQPGWGAADAPTGVGTSPKYRHELAQLVLSGLSWRARHTESTAPPTIVEVGGGAGELKREIMELVNAAGAEVNFISVEPNPNHRRAQEFKGTTVFDGRAEKMPLPTGSVDLLFDEEVLDCFPPRVLRWDRKRAELSGELFVERRGDELAPVFRPWNQSDAALQECQETLAKADYQRNFYCLTPGYWDYLRESARVLKPGGVRLSSDYGYTCSQNFPPSLCPDNLAHFERAVSRPYWVDLTHWVDFSYLAQLAVAQGGFWPIRILSLPGLFEKHSRDAALDAMGRMAFLAVRTQSPRRQPGEVAK